MGDQSFCLRWSEYSSQVSALLSELRLHEELVDVTLCCSGRSVRAHRLMLSAASPYFRNLMRETSVHQPVMVFLKDVQFEDLLSVLEFVYTGEVSIAQGRMARFVQTAEMLQIRGLSADSARTPPANPETSCRQPVAPRQRCRSSSSTASPLLSPGPSCRSQQPLVARPRQSPSALKQQGASPSLPPVQVKRPISPASPALTVRVKQERNVSPACSPASGCMEHAAARDSISLQTVNNIVSMETNNTVSMETNSPILPDGVSESLTSVSACTDSLSTVTEASAPLRHLSSFVRNWR